ncbi:DUF4912 domain-containing protein [Verrucomicrobium sp. 3C]|uniref:DUF4912 domain-containing protein n=1 Tax=Verrucomicrobium sp. 3C TaxID=1134055 RepID=UPI0009DAA4F6|nr:DUF4912 domain-containing protein [Verrucomicrobium sp. 3C]
MTSRKTPLRPSSRTRSSTSGKPVGSRRRRPSSKAPRDPFLAVEPVTGSEAERTRPPSVDPPSDGLFPPAVGSDTVRLYLTPRGPNSLFAYWNWPEERLAQAARAADDGCILLRLRRSDGRVREEHALPPGCRNWYFSLSESGETFSVELGTYQTQGTRRTFLSLGASQPVASPRFTPSERTDRTLATLPPGVPFRQLAREFRPVTLPGEQLVETLARIQDQGQECLPHGESDLISRWVAAWPAGQAAGSWGGSPSSFGLFSWPGSFPWPGSGVTAWPGSFAWPSSWAFSPFGASWAIPPGVGRERGFFLHVNAELILYGGTDPQAQVTVLGHPIALEPGGTFRYHFLLPDGSYRIPIEAVSPDGVETRGATLSFLRESEYLGKVDATAQPPLPPEPLGRTAG